MIATRPQNFFHKSFKLQSEFLFVPEKRFYAPVTSRDLMRG